MRGSNRWDRKPYRPFDKMDELSSPFICRIAPSLNTIDIEWISEDLNDLYYVFYRIKDSMQSWSVIEANDKECKIEELQPYTDYEFFVQTTVEQNLDRRNIRYARTGEAPGVVVNYLHPMDDAYAFSGKALCSPSIVKLANGDLLSSMDVFAGREPQNLTLIFRSVDNGKTWQYVCDLFPCYWGTLFVCRSRLYMLATTTEYGDVVISESTDNGETWNKPTSLFYGSGSYLASGWQHTPTPVIEYQGRIYTSIDYGAWRKGGHGICLLSCPASDDLCDATNWTVTAPVRYDPSWEGAPKGRSGGLLEGNIVISPKGDILDILRLQINDCTPNHGLSCVLRADSSNPEKKLEFDRFCEMETGSNSKTHILFDKESGYFIAIGDICVDVKTPGQRNVLAMECSKDLIHWRICKILLDYRNENPNKVGFQYIFSAFDGQDIVYVSRTSINDARNFHDANYQTFHRIIDFRKFL